MKKIILILAITLTGSFAYAQKMSSSDVPTVVTSKFSSLYPNCKAEQWKKEKGNYETKFKQNDTKTCVVIDPNGNLVRTATTITNSELPKSVNDYVAKNYADNKITKAEKVIDADGTVRYEADVNKTNLCFDVNGLFLRSEKRKS